MLHLIHKDIMIFINKWNIIFILGFTFFILFIADTAIPQGQYLLIASTIAFLASSSSFAFDEISNSEFIIQSLPVTQKEIVFAKYIGVIINSLISIIYTTFIFFLLDIFGLLEMNFLNIYLIFMIPLILLLMTSINFPIYFKIGYKKAKIFNIVILVPFFILMNAFASNLEKNKSLLLNLIKLPDLDFLIPIVIIAIALLSMAISLRLYTAKDL